MAAGTVLAATGLVTAACLQGGGSAAGTGGSTTDTAAAGPNQAVAAAYQTTADTRSAKLAMTTQVGIGNESVPVKADGLVDFANRAADLTEQLPGQGVTAETRFVNGMLYEQVPNEQVKRLAGGKPWISVDVSKLSTQGDGSLQQLMSDSPSDPSTMLGYLRGAGAQVTTVGQDTVDGVSTTHYKVTIDLDKAAAGQDSQTQQGIQALEQEIGSHTVPADVWLDDQGRLREFTMKETLSGPQATSTTPQATSTTSAKPTGALTVGITAMLSDFGVPVTVTAPPADQTADLTDKLTGH